MKKFLFVHRGYGEKAEGMEKAWADWFAKEGEHIVDMGAPFTAGRLVKGGGTSDINLAEGLTGYMMVSAVDMDAAIAIAEGMPITHGMEVYETRPM